MNLKFTYSKYDKDTTALTGDHQQLWEQFRLCNRQALALIYQQHFFKLYNYGMKISLLQFCCSYSWLVFLGLAFWYGYEYHFKNITISTAYRELRTVVLPDHSVVKLNAHSQINYSRTWHSDHPREVWLNGEAFFSVTHQANHAPFVAHTNHLEVQVLRTEFNVDQREDKTQIVLNSGKVKVDFQDRQTK